MNGFQIFYAWLTGMEKLIFDYNNFFGSGYFLTCFSDLMDQKRAGAKKVVIIKNQFFHARQLRKGIFEIHSHRCSDFNTFFPELLMASTIPGFEFFS